MPEPEGFTGYVAGSGLRLKRLALLLSGNEADAEDLLQTALAKLYLVWPRIIERGDPDAYVRRTIVTTHAGLRRRLWFREQPVESLPDQTLSPDGAERIDARLLLRAALAALPPRERAAVVLRHYVDLSEHDTAAALGCTVGTVKTLCSRGLRRLRTHSALRAERHHEEELPT